MSFFNKLVSEFTGGGQQQQQQYQGPPPQQYQQGPPPQQYGQGPPPPPVSPPWYAEWEGREGRWLFVNQQTGERTFNYPGPGYGGQQQYGGPPPQHGYGTPPPQHGYGAPPPPGYGAYGGGPPPQQGYGGPPPPQGYGAPPPPQGYGGGYGGPPPQQQYGEHRGEYNRPAPPPPEEHKKSGGSNAWKYAAGGAVGLAGGALLMHNADNIGASPYPPFALRAN